MIKKVSLLFTIFLACNITFAQEEENKQKKKADELYEKFAYIDAIKIYEKIAEKGYIDQNILENLGNSYYFNADYPTALKWYDMLFQKAKEEPDNFKPAVEYYYRYAQTLKSVERYDEANEVLKQFVKLSAPDNVIAQKIDNNIDYLKQIRDNSGRLNIKPVSVNTEHSEYGSAYYDNDKVIITASRKPSLFKSASKWTGDGYYDLFATDLEADGDIRREVRFSSDLNSELNESTPIFTKDYNTVYFTRNYNNPLKEKDKKGNEDLKVLLELYKSTRNASGQWQKPRRLPFNIVGYSLAHPALSPDEKYLYFASDIPGTHGKSDIFRVEIKEDGTYGKPENLGEKINTEGRETFPFITDDNILFFASDGLPGLGGLDIFGVKINADGSLGRLQNIGRPGNSPDDDFAFVLNTKTRQGFLSSNRPGGKGKDDIYSFLEITPLIFNCQKVITGIVRDAETKEILTDVKVTLSDKRQNELQKITNQDNGEFAFNKQEVECGDDYVYVRAQKEDYSVAENKVDITKSGDNIRTELFLQRIRKQFTVGDNLAKFFNIEIIYFDFDKSNIRYDAAVDLSKIVEVMKEYPKMKIAIKSHTDSRGSDAYNLALSDRRAKSTLEWMVKQGISRDRLTAKGYGETQLVNGCSNGIPCTEEEHQANRRSEFIITEM